jgi:threonine dehydrogenase-like Zn-dependent dehydrogenase
VLLELISKGEIDPSYPATHRTRLSDGPHAYEIFGQPQQP